MKRLLALLLLALPARAATTTVAVMPFKDLSGGGSGAVGEAIRETVTSDLKEISGLRVIERGNLDKILAEQKLQAERSDLDAQAAARIGKLLGATHICAGAYQKVPPQVRLTARFIKVETGEIVGTAKVDGPASSFLKLQDKVTALLLARTGLGHHAKKIEERSRPPVKSLDTLEFYGQAVLADNDDLRKKYLKLALAEDENFAYASRDLAALEKRMRGYEQRADAARADMAREAHAKLAEAKDAGTFFGLMGQVMVGLQQSRRYHAMAAEARWVMEHAPTFPQLPGMPAPVEMAHYWLVLAESQLREHDQVLRDGEAFLRKYPASTYFSSVKQMMDQTIGDKRKVEEGKAALPAKLAEIPPAQREPCRLGFLYLSIAMYREARDQLRLCADGKGSTAFKRLDALPQVIEMSIQLADWQAARRDIAAFEKEFPAEYRSWKSAWDFRMPSD